MAAAVVVAWEQQMTSDLVHQPPHVLPCSTMASSNRCCAASVPCPPAQAKKLFEEKFKTGKNRWFFNKLRF
jgi:hypothetical protein